MVVNISRRVQVEMNASDDNYKTRHEHSLHFVCIGTTRGHPDVKILNGRDKSPVSPDL